MRKIRIVTDSTSDLPLELKEKHQIETVPLYVRFGEEFFADGVDIDNRAIFKRVSKTGAMPQTAAPTPENFSEIFKKLIDEDQDVICICLSSPLSATVQSATIAASEFPTDRIEIIDSLNLSTGIGLLVLYAAELAEQGMPFKELVEMVEKQRANLETYFAVDTMDYLYKGGRCTGLQHLMAGMLKIHPVLTMEEGQIIVKDKIRGGNRKIQDRLMDYIVANEDQIDFNYIAVPGADCDREVKSMIKRIKERYPKARIISAEAGSVISSHCGPGTIGLMFFKKQ
ncbi:MAG: DegV family protein [Bacillota bacterium]